jgi:hypothetical protein
LQNAALEGMPLAQDCYRTWKVAEMGSVWWCSCKRHSTGGLCQLSRLLIEDVSPILPRAQAVSRMPSAIAALRMCCQRRVAAETCWHMRDRTPGASSPQDRKPIAEFCGTVMAMCNSGDKFFKDHGVHRRRSCSTCLLNKGNFARTVDLGTARLGIAVHRNGTGAGNFRDNPLPRIDRCRARSTDRDVSRLGRELLRR